MGKNTVSSCHGKLNSAKVMRTPINFVTFAQTRKTIPKIQKMSITLKSILIVVWLVAAFVIWMIFTCDKGTGDNGKD